MWLYLSIASAAFLGVYDVFKKWSVRDNAPLLVLFLSVCFGAGMTIPVFGLSIVNPEAALSIGLFCRMLTLQEHLLVLLKAMLVSVSWISAFFALKHLPISIVTPIRASAPLWTLLGAVLLFGERPAVHQWIGIGIIFFSYFAFSFVGKKEGIVFSKNRWVFLVFVATVSGAASALYDKYLLRNAGIDPVSLQVWFSFYLVGVIGGAVAWVRAISKKSFVDFKWRYTIALIGIFLIIADYLYFRALSSEDALIAVISVIRRSSVAVSFVVGGLLFKEKNKRQKAVPLVGVLVGVALLLTKAH
jgi:transporter family protein